MDSAPPGLLAAPDTAALDTAALDTAQTDRAWAEADFGAALPVGTYLVRRLYDAGARVAFGIPGRSIHWLLAALARAEAGRITPLRFVLARHEGGAAFMADGYARTSGRLGVCLVTAGPGVTNAATGVLCAQSDGSPVVLVSGECPIAAAQRGGFQTGLTKRADVHAMMASITAEHCLVRSVEVLPEQLDSLLHTVRRGAGQTAHLSVPMDVGESEIRPPRRSCVAPARATLEASVEAALRRAWQALASARRPLILLGSGCRRALSQHEERSTSGLAERFRTRLVERHGIPVMSTPAAKGIFPEHHPLSLHSYGIAASEWSLRYLDPKPWPDGSRYDALLALGTRLGQWATRGWSPQLAPEGPFFSIADEHPAESGYREAERIWAPPELVLERLVQWADEAPPAVTARSREQAVAHWTKATQPWVDAEQREASTSPLAPPRVMAELQRVLDHYREVKRRGVNLFVDIGNVTGWSWHHLTLSEPHRMFSNPSMGSMGWATGAAIGGKLGDPNRFSLALSGDAAFLMNGTEVSTARQARIAVVWLVLDDDSHGMVADGMASLHGDVAACSWRSRYGLGSPDLVAFARSLGAEAERVSQPGQLEQLLPEAFRRAECDRRPQVLVADIDPRLQPPYPHLPAQRAAAQ